MLNEISVLVISIANPILVGIYQDDKLIETIFKEGKTSDILPLIFDDILSKYKIDNISYVNGPGSYMAIKVAYIFLKTLSIVKNLKFKAIDGFSLNDNSPIKALGKKYFFKSKENIIVIESLNDTTKLKDFKLPLFLKEIKFSDNTDPAYNLPVI